MHVAVRGQKEGRIGYASQREHSHQKDGSEYVNA